MTTIRRLLLLSNSTVYGQGYLDHADSMLRSFLGSARALAFVPHAVHDVAGYVAMVRSRCARLGCQLVSVHEEPDSSAADALFIGGGNTFRLVAALHRLDLMDPIRAFVSTGKPFVGSSAGSIVACPTIQTTKDMPAVEPPSFRALGLVPFQISPHYQDPDPHSTHMGETQEQRIGHYHEDNDRIVLGLREGTMLHVECGAVTLHGVAGARVFVKGKPPVEAPAGARLDHVLA